MNKYSIRIIAHGSIVFTDVIKAKDSGHAVSRILGILESYDDFKIECVKIKDGE